VLFQTLKIKDKKSIENQWFLFFTHLFLTIVIKNVDAYLSQINPEYILIQDRLNNRPQKSLGWKTPV